MRSFKDKQYGLTWYSGDLGEERQNKVDKSQRIDLCREMNYWNSSDIREYIRIDRNELGSFMYGASGADEQYFAYDDGKLVSSVIIFRNQQLMVGNELAKYIEICDKAGLDCYKGCISRIKAQRALDNNNSVNNAYLAYIVVDPMRSGTGVGTRVLRSINANRDFFAGMGIEHNTIYSRVRYDNIASQKMFRNAEYSKIYYSPEKVMLFDELYHVK